MYCTLARIFLPTPKQFSAPIWTEVQKLWPEDFKMDEAMLRKKHTQIQKKKTTGKTGHSWLGKRGIGGKRRFAGVKMS